MRHRALDPAAAWRWQGLGAPGGVGEGEELVWMLKGEEVVQQPLKLIWSKVEEDGLVRRVERIEASFEQSEGVGAALRDTTALFAALLANGDAALLSNHDAFLKTAVCVAHDHLSSWSAREKSSSGCSKVKRSSSSRSS